jgi:hypothetical protein
MDFLLGLVVGWVSMPYVLVGTLLFLSGFPIFFWGYDIYEDDRWKYSFWRTILFMILTGAALHVFTDFKVWWLLGESFWETVLRLWIYILGFLVVGYLFSMVRFFFYARKFNKRRARALGPNPSEAEKDRAYRSRLSSFGSRKSLILKWIFHWPWSLLAWILTDLLKSLVDLMIDVLRPLLGRGFGAIARANEPEWMRERERAEREQAKAARN